MMKFLACILTIISTATTFGLIVPIMRRGPCPKIQARSTFDIQAFMGTWFEIERFPSRAQYGQCDKVHLSLRPDGKIDVENTEIRANGKMHTRRAVGAVPDPNEPAVLRFEYGVGHRRIPSGYRIVSTDYTSFSLVTACAGFGYVHVEFAWLLSRKKYLSQTVIDSSKLTLKGSGFATHKFQRTRQTDC